MGVVVASVVAATTMGLSPSGGAAAAPSVDRASVGESVRYLVEAYGVPEREALRRLDLQKQADELDGALRKDASAEYGGMWIDHAAGGELVVAMTDTAAAELHLAKLPDRSHVRTRTVEHSLAELTEARGRIAARVGAGPDAVYLPAVSEVENRVVVWERAWAPQAASLSAASDTAKRAVDAEPGLAVVRPLAKPQPMATPNVDLGFCHPLYCTGYGPMRGGLRLDMKRDNGTWGGCTSAFNLRSTGGGFPGKAWVLTAGHCMATKTNGTPTQHNGNDVVQQHGIEKNAYPYDYAALPYVNAAAATTWLDGQTGRNRVLKYCRNGGLDSNPDTPCGQQATSVDEYITGTHTLAEIKAGWIVCATGSGSSAINYPDSVDSGAGQDYLVGTRCGRVLSTDVGINTDICARAGDSGGPLFSQVDHTALGILEGSQQARSGPCQLGELNNYVPIETIITELNERVAGQGSTFAVITTPNG
ncbi:S1 family peptidase [Umezawaea endophytica]|uniref:S1 family peptidase n=1 Tax=Umezawaea endophytica TaxID=1654476 RepID=A0A9X2ZZS9_9PSEU|nr:S1 family peptidase [Umezawaea endophytica]MCS7476203.1 S1 family peptidase [Umezawaea endophytica]